ncbi:hypothetical protein J437_LFUL016110 [Ladona fulva]|uniref:Retroviral polymerase SH3-like domain-containing protein n=1 Tax=Ladona fulva TaxID=123851 RepID=A0A8K0KMK4_LADFU|nr:hypothetical protein J437_LFUL016110 [Ladona fulva]
MCPSSAIGDKIPLEVWNDRKLNAADYEHIKIFGCQAWAWVPVKEGKFSPRAKECVMLGYQEGIKGYRLWSLKEQKVIISRDVLFREDVFPYKVRNDPEKRLMVKDHVRVQVAEWSPPGVKGETEDEELPTVGEEELPNAGEEGVQQHNLVGEENAELRSSSRPRVPRICPCCYLVNGISRGDVLIPETAEEALSGMYACEWRAAMEEGVKHMREQQTWEIVKTPEGSLLKVGLPLIMCHQLRTVLISLPSLCQDQKARSFLN